MAIRVWRSYIFCWLACLLPPSAQAEALNDNKPFAEKHVLLQVSSRDQYASVLNIASNLQKHYGPDVIDIQVVTFAAGIELLRRMKIHLNQGLRVCRPAVCASSFARRRLIR